MPSVVGSVSDETVIQELSRTVRSLGMDLDHVAADVFSIKHCLNSIEKDETMKLQLQPIEQEVAVITKRFQKHFDGDKQDMDLLKSEVEAIRLQELQKARTNEQNIQNVPLEQIEKPILHNSKIKSDADRSIEGIIDKFKGEVKEFSNTSSQQDKLKEREQDVEEKLSALIQKFNIQEEEMEKKIKFFKEDDKFIRILMNKSVQQVQQYKTEINDTLQKQIEANRKLKAEIDDTLKKRSEANEQLKLEVYAMKEMLEKQMRADKKKEDFSKAIESGHTKDGKKFIQ